MKKRTKVITKAIAAAALGVSLLAGNLSYMGTVVADEPESSVTFKTQSGGTYDGMPLFDANEEHLDEYLEVLFDYLGLEGAAVYATDTRQDYTLRDPDNPNVGKKIPGAAQAGDHVQGVSTDFPAMVTLGQTWNKGLVNKVGTVLGDEHISTVNYANTAAFNSITYTAVSDLRINPLSGRIDESFAEDAYLAGTMVDNMAQGVSGTSDDNNFWLKNITGTKHYSNYAAQWFRQMSSIDTSIRGTLEYQTKSVVKGVESGAVAGVMTSYGAVAGVPNIMSQYINYMRDYSPYGFYTSPDANAYNHAANNNLQNGYDTRYSPDASTSLALFMIANSTAGGNSFGVNHNVPMNLVNSVKAGYYGLTEEHVYETAREQIVPLIRVGLFNERDSSNNPINYPFLKQSNGYTTTNFNTESSQDVAMQAANESVVLLKNDNNTLPLDKDDELILMGAFAGSRFKTTYSVGTTPAIENTALSPYYGLNLVSKEGKAAGAADTIEFKSGNKIVALKSKLTGKFLAAPSGEAGGSLTADADDTSAAAAQFSLYDWGQDGYSIMSLENNKWLANTTSGSFTLTNTGTANLNTTENPWDNAINVGNSTMPAVYRMVNNADGTVSFISNSFTSSFGGGYEFAYYSAGRYLKANSDGTTNVTSTTLTNAETAAAMCTDDEKFELVVLSESGKEIENYTGADEKDYAVVVVGAPERHSAGEGADRSSLSMGKEQYELVNKVSSEYPGKTIVIVKSSFPVLMEEIQNNDDVAAILYQPYAGQYDGYALAKTVYGDISPSARLTSTWYASDDALPEISSYSFPQGSAYNLSNIDPRITVDYTNADGAQSSLTYMYTDAPVTYEFGYGLSYSNISYSNVNVGSADADGNFNVSVRVSNSGKIKTSEVVQVYIKNNSSSYGSNVAKKQLVSYEKVELAAGETKTVTLKVLGDDYALWSTNDEAFVLENSSYTVMVGKSSENIVAEKSLNIGKQEFASLDLFENIANVYDKSFASSNVTYREVSKETTITSLKDKKLVGGYTAIMSKGAGAWTAINNVELSRATDITLRVAAANGASSISVRMDSPTGTEIANVPVAQTAAITKTLAGITEAGNIDTSELGYDEVTVALSGASGTHDLYLVFADADVRVDTISLKDVVDKTELDTVISEADHEEMDYTEDSWNAYKEALDKAVEVSADADAKQSDIDKAVKDLKDAIDALVTYDLGPAKKDDLIEFVDSANYVQDNYTSDSWKNYEKALRAAKAVIRDADATQGEADDALAAVKKAAEDLKRIPMAYQDVFKGQWYYDYVEYMHEKMIMTGLSNTQFGIGQATGRAQFATMLYRIEGNPDVTYTQKFKDVLPGAWYSDAIAWAESVGVVTGYDNGYFGISDHITREQMVTMLYRYADYKGIDTSKKAALTGFPDNAKVSAFAKAAMGWAIEVGIITGDSGKINPQGKATREQCATMVTRYMKAFIDK